MIIGKVLGKLGAFAQEGRMLDTVELEWYETAKRILHKRSSAGKEIVLKRLNEKESLEEGDVIFADLVQIISIMIKPCDVVAIKPEDSCQLAAACYEIGNRHLPLFYENGTLLVPFEKPLFHMLQAAGFEAVHTTAKLLHPLKTSVRPHGNVESESLFSKIIKLTTNHG